MNKDGDILGSRRRVEASQPGSSGTLTASSLPGSSCDVGGTIGSTRHPPGASPLKRQRSTGGGPARAESETIEGPSGDVPVDQLTPEQLKRFQAWKRSRLERGCIRELILDRAAPTLVRTLESGQGTGVLKETSTIAVASMAKMFVGDIVEEAKRAQLERGDEGPLLPSDLLEARERLARDRRLPPLRPPSSRERGLTGGGGGGGEGGGGKSLLGGHAMLVKGNAL